MKYHNTTHECDDVISVPVRRHLSLCRQHVSGRGGESISDEFSTSPFLFFNVRSVSAPSEHFLRTFYLLLQAENFLLQNVRDQKRADDKVMSDVALEMK